MKNTKKTSKGEISIQNGLNTLFLLYMGALYPLIMHDKYFDITLTKYKAFSVAVCIYAVLMVLAVLVDVLDAGKTVKAKADKENRMQNFLHRHNIMIMDFFALGFLAANVIAFFMAHDKSAAYTGVEGRRCGLQFMIIAMFVYLCIGRRCRIHRIVAPVLAVAGMIVSVIGILQYVDIDFLHLRDGIAENAKDIYITTFGNIDIFAGFLCVFIPVAAGAYIAGTGNIKRSIILLAAILVGSGAVIISNANLAYAGVSGAMLLAWIWSAYRGKVRRFADVCVSMAAGVLLIGMILDISGEGYDKLDGLSCFVSNRLMVVATFAAVVIIRILLQLGYRQVDRFCGKTGVIVSVSISLCAIAAAVVYGSVKHMGIFAFEDSWGNYRGFVWKRLMESYKDFSLPQKIFGYGNESVKDIMTSSYYEEMMDKVGVVYDNAHNEYLQYLVTTGILGLVSYAGLVVTSLITLVRTAVAAGGNDMECYTKGFVSGYEDGEGPYIAVTLGIVGYAVQAFVNLNQSLTTPYMFLLIALAAGICRNYKSTIK